MDIILKSISILGIDGVPASYGGFETLADNLAIYANDNNLQIKLSIYCSGSSSELSSYNGATLRYIPVSANGAASVLYDTLSLFSSVRNKDQLILLLGVSGAITLPFIRLISRVRIVTNIDGIEWKRDKWNAVAKQFLKISEYLAVKFSHDVIADNQAIADHVRSAYGAECRIIAYGGDHAVNVEAKEYCGELPDKYAFALCRIEPENNVELILQGFEIEDNVDLVFVGNWDSSQFGRDLKLKFGNIENIHLLDPIYDTGVLKTIRSNSFAYIHGHSAGGTNPALVEMMHFGIPVLAFDCTFNRFTTDNMAIYFSSMSELAKKMKELNSEKQARVGSEMRRIAKARYTWARIGQEYFKLLDCTV